jgi:hypothetical protein
MVQAETSAQPAAAHNVQDALALAQQVFNQNMQQLAAVSQQQAINLLQVAVLARAVAWLEPGGGNDGPAKLEQLSRDIGHILAQVQALYAAPSPASAA